MSAAVTVTLPLDDAQTVEISADGPITVMLGKVGQVKATCKEYVSIRRELHRLIVTSPADGTANIIISGMQTLAKRYILSENLPEEPVAKALTNTIVEVPPGIVIIVRKTSYLEIRGTIIVKDERT